MVQFKNRADRIIKEMTGIEVERIRSDRTYEEQFYTRRRKGKWEGKIYGWPIIKGPWCNSYLKVKPLNNAQKNTIQYIGIAADEPGRFHNLSDTKKSPLVEAGWTETMCREWCEANGLLSPIYTSATRGGCWFCHNQSVQQLRLLRKEWPEYWALMLKWDKDSHITFKPDGHTVRDYERRFAEEDAGHIAPGPFRWCDLENELTIGQMNLFEEDNEESP